jgi:putative toxin-antitoxin system antitoxin component (TIGR02293 family)
MGAKPFTEVYEKAKELRRQGELNTQVKSSIAELFRKFAVEHADFVTKFEASNDLTDANLLRVVEIKALSDRVFGSEEKAESWLQRPNASLSGQKPMDLLKDELGTAVVRELLERIDHGIFA